MNDEVDWDSAEPDESLIDYEGRILLWCGSFPSEAAYQAYFSEQYSEDDDDNMPLSKFSFDFRLGRAPRFFYDHDFVSRIYLGPGLNPAEQILSEMRFSKGYISKAIQLLADKQVLKANCAVILLDQNAEYEVGDKSPNSDLKFVGAFYFEEGLLAEVDQ